ncbi:MAG: ribosome-associated translation inhibitor RaiA [Elusimicrobia bacterium]|nr:ribosome-associated translation inhibitor RaiA [Elusimicrobiota bacterium]
MQIKITARHIKLTDAIANYARKKAEKAQHYFSNVVNVQIILSVDKYRQKAEIILHTGRTGAKSIFRAKEVSSDLYAAIDLAMDKIDKQLKKIKEMAKIHRKGNLKTAALKKIGEISFENIDENDRRKINISEVNRFDVKPESLEEAVNQMEALGNKFYMFFNSDTSQINVLYKKDNGTLGLIEPEI